MIYYYCSYSQSDGHSAPRVISHLIQAWSDPSVWYLMKDMIFCPLIQRLALLYGTLQSVGRNWSLGGKSYWNQYSIAICGSEFCPSQTIHVHSGRCSVSTSNIEGVIVYYVIVPLQIVQPTLIIVINTERCSECCNFHSISVSSSLYFSTYILKISTWSTIDCLIHYFKWLTWLEQWQNSTVFHAGDIQ